MGDPRDDLKKRAQEDGIEFFFAMFVDMHGKQAMRQAHPGVVVRGR
jgi:hypothetical protein